MNYMEPRDKSATYKKNYAAGITDVIKKRWKEVNSLRCDYRKNIFQTPERYRSDLKEILGWPLVGNAETTVPPSTVTRKPLQTAAPVEGEIVMVYAMDSLGYNPTTRDWRTHNGVDIAAEEGSKVFAAADGTVYTVYEDDTMGMTVVIRHRDGYITKYASLASEVTVKAGDTVTLGQQIGYVGNTALLESAIGDHLHFSVTCNDEPVDPAEFLN
jgi:murein DD-endopeptidase MepM/ murein hydrolase activator NlpD